MMSGSIDSRSVVGRSRIRSGQNVLPLRGRVHVGPSVSAHKAAALFLPAITYDGRRMARRMLTRSEMVRSTARARLTMRRWRMLRWFSMTGVGRTVWRTVAREAQRGVERQIKSKWGGWYTDHTRRGSDDGCRHWPASHSSAGAARSLSSGTRRMCAGASSP